MADIELVIKIPEELLGKIDDENYQSVISWYDTTLYCAIKDGKPLRQGHGDLIDKDEFLLNLGNEHIGGIEAIKEYTGEDTWTDGLHTAWRVIDDMSAIIESDKENRDEG